MTHHYVEGSARTHIRLEAPFFEAFKRIKGNRKSKEVVDELITLGLSLGSYNKSVALRIGILLKTEQKADKVLLRVQRSITSYIESKLHDHP